MPPASPEARLQRWLLGIAVLSYLADSMLVPFYPQYFQQVYGLAWPMATGLYVAVCRLGVLGSFQFWAKLAQRVPVMRLLTYTQGAAGVLCLACAAAPNVLSFVVLSVLADLCKSSYLLLYPHLIRVAGREQEARVIASMGFIVNLGIVGAALAGGALFDGLNPRYIIVGVALLDFGQLFISRHVLRMPHPSNEVAAPATEDAAPTPGNGRRLVGVAALMFVFYFTFMLLRPFYTRYLAGAFPGISLKASGLLFVIPSILAVGIAPFTRRITTDHTIRRVLLGAALVLGLATLAQLASPSLGWLVAARIGYGAALFLLEIGIDYLLFRWSAAADMMGNYRVINFMQNLAIILAPLLASYAVETASLTTPFLLATAGALALVPVTLFCFRSAFRPVSYAA